jgi:hypothetical protein
MTAVYTLDCGIRFPATAPGMVDASEHKTVCRRCTQALREVRDDGFYDETQMQRIARKFAGVRCG